MRSQLLRDSCNGTSTAVMSWALAMQSAASNAGIGPSGRAHKLQASCTLSSVISLLDQTAGTAAIQHSSAVQFAWCSMQASVCFCLQSKPVISSSPLCHDRQLCSASNQPMSVHAADDQSLEEWHAVLQMVCNRCHATSELAFASDAVASGSQQGTSGSIQVSAQCAKCHQDWFAGLQPRLVHAHSNVLASIRAQGCAPLDLLPSLMAAQCSNCTAAASLRFEHLHWNLDGLREACLIMRAFWFTPTGLAFFLLCCL